MIRINLATRKQVASGDRQQKADGILGSLFGGSKADLNDKLKELPLRKILLMILVGGLASYLADDFMAQKLSEVDSSIKKLTVDQSRLQAELKKTEGYEELKKQLDADEFVLKTKIETIDKLVADRQIAPRLLLALASSIPQDVWLSSLVVQQQEIALTGASLGFNQISDFMKVLNENAFFSELNLRKTEQGKDEFGSVIATFELMAKRRQ
ncbi:MAG: hypothetical protein A3K03_04205 [Bdellovibrionales bacterium RIFOXYD1_FULL_44_7]|nr:MAG: hypothetical protein A3K03_04205 [Bdellovibrionales bacterium RIFOXYD1_FULL_44_7]